MLIAVVAARDVAVVTLTWLLGLAHGIGATLDRQVVRWLWLRRRATRLIALGPALPLTAAVLAAAERSADAADYSRAGHLQGRVHAARRRPAAARVNYHVRRPLPAR